MKQNRQSHILEIISKNEISTQSELLKALRNDGFDVTQATVSRDIKELGLIKTSAHNGRYKYTSSQANSVPSNQHLNIFSGTITNISSALHTIVIHTYPGMAPAVAASLDSSIAIDILGSIAGDDTILLICESENAAYILKQRLCAALNNEKKGI